MINPNIKYSILKSLIGTSYKFQKLLHHSCDRYYITSKLILPKEKDIFIKEIGKIHNCTLSSIDYVPSLDFKTIKVMYSLCYSVRPLLQHIKSKQRHTKRQYIDYCFYSMMPTAVLLDAGNILLLST